MTKPKSESNRAQAPALKQKQFLNNTDQEISTTSTNVENKNLPNCQSRFDPSSLLATVKDVPGGVNVQTLSNIYRAKVIDAYRNRRIFTVYGNYHTIRRALLRRGWLEKLTSGRFPKLSGFPVEVLLQNAKQGNDFEAMAISKIINNLPAFFIWQPKEFHDVYVDVLPYRNRVRRSNHMDFSNKVGLIGCAQQEHWFHSSGFCGMKYPRFYCIVHPEERVEFIEEYRRTQCRNLARFVIEQSGNLDLIIDEDNGTVSATVLRYAMNCMKCQLSDWNHNELDDVGEKFVYDQAEWKEFLEKSKSLICGNGKIKCNIKELNEFRTTVMGYLNKIQEIRPDYKWDGTRNFWILKPGYQCRGCGIVIKSSLDDILSYASTNAKNKYIAQKYIERPLLIHKCKFDIRQYILLTIDERNASIWMYKDCYFKICAREFTFGDLHESVHLTNFTVQKHYGVQNTRDSCLPQNHMWSLEQFQTFLKHQKAPADTWDNIYAGFRENVIAVVLSSFEETDFVENAFELYGCDFMLDENYTPILIEINHTPDLSASTDVTARLCPMVLKDLVKVVVDLPLDSNAPTGLFDLVYKVNYKTKDNSGINTELDIKGNAMKLFHQRIALSGKPLRKSIPKQAEINLKTPIIKTLATTHSPPISKVQSKLKPSNNVTSEITPKLKHRFGIEKTGKEVKQLSLEPFTKEALALHYTRPK